MLDVKRISSIRISFLLLCCIAASAEAQIVFDPAVAYPAGSGTGDIDAADIDGDGDTDLVFDNNNAVSILYNQGNGTFGPRILLTAGDGPTDPTVVDVDNDGDDDLVVGNAIRDSLLPDEFSVLLNAGNGTFPVRASYAVGAVNEFPVFILSADVTGDGFPDLVMGTGNASQVYVHVNDGFGGFTPGWSGSSGRAYDGTAADVNNDGHIDLLVASPTETFQVLLNDGTGAFNLAGFIPVGPTNGTFSGPVSIDAADFDGDGNADVVTEKYDSSSSGIAYPSYVMISFGDGQGGFAPSVDIDLGPHTEVRVVKAVDLNGDGRDEILAMDSDLNRVHYMTNFGNGVFDVPVGLAVGDEPRDLTAGDFDGDGDSDVVSCNLSSLDVSVLINQTQQPGLPPYPGTMEDFILGTGVNGPPTSGFGQFVKTATSGDTLFVAMSSPSGTFNFVPPVLLGQLFPAGSPPAPPFGFTELHVNENGGFVIFDGLRGPFGVVVLPPTGLFFNFLIPAGLTGFSLMLQGLALAPFANNGIFAASDGYETQFL